MRVKKQQLEADMELWTGSELEKEYGKATYCHPDYFTCLQSTSCKIMEGNAKLGSRLTGKRSTTSDVQMIPL